MNRAEEFLQELPDWVTPEHLQRVFGHYKDGAFEFDFSTGEHTVLEDNIIYHVIPHYADDGAETILSKLCRIMNSELETPNE